LRLFKIRRLKSVFQADREDVETTLAPWMSRRTRKIDVHTWLICLCVEKLVEVYPSAVQTTTSITRVIVYKVSYPVLA
jgi:hypothetical protein